MRNSKLINKSFRVFAGDQCFRRKKKKGSMKGMGRQEHQGAGEIWTRLVEVGSESGRYLRLGRLSGPVRTQRLTYRASHPWNQ